MKPEDIRRLYRGEQAASDAEAARTRAETLRDPDAARALIKTLYSLALEDRSFAQLLRMFLEASMMRLIEEHAEQDDAFALDSAGLIFKLMDLMAPPPRGKPKSARSA